MQEMIVIEGVCLYKNFDPGGSVPAPGPCICIHKLINEHLTYFALVQKVTI